MLIRPCPYNFHVVCIILFLSSGDTCSTLWLISMSLAVLGWPEQLGLTFCSSMAKERHGE